MTLADDLVDALVPWWSQDYEDLARAIGSMFGHAELYCRDEDDDNGLAGWAVMLDPDNAPTEALPYLAQWVGERARAGSTDQQMRDLIHGRPNAMRGSPQSIGLAAQRSLTGARTVQLFERTKANGTADPNGDEFVVYTYAAETPDPAQVAKDLLSVTPADMVCNYTMLTASTWASTLTGHATWALVNSGYPSWTQVRALGVGGGTDWAS